MEITERAVFRVTRDADFEVSDDADDLLEAVESELRRRRFGDVVRLEVSGRLPRHARTARVGLGAEPTISLRDRGHARPRGALQLTKFERPDLKYEPWVPVTQPRLARVEDASDFFAEIRRGDLLVHQPYESFRPSFEAFVARRGGSGRDRDQDVAVSSVRDSRSSQP